MSLKPGQIYKVDLGFEGKVRFMIVVSRFDPDSPRALALCVPVTAQNRGSKYEVALGGGRPFSKPSFANVQGTTAIEYHELGPCLGSLPQNVFQHIRAALAYALEMSAAG